jgi:hypothetical protein
LMIPPRERRIEFSPVFQRRERATINQASRQRRLKFMPRQAHASLTRRAIPRPSPPVR